MWCNFSILSLLSLLYSFGHVLSSPSDGNSCLTPDNQMGRCVVLAECPHLHELSKAGSLDRETADFLEESRCGMEKNSSKVCCSHSRRGFFPPHPVMKKPSPPGPGKNIYSSCGKSIKQVRIIGGKSTTPGEWPWIVAIGFRTSSKPRTQFVCGGALISDTWVVTAGHCFHNIGKSTMSVVRVGELDLKGDSLNDIPIEKVILHPRFTANPLLNDIALLRLRNHVTFTDYIRPICVPNLNEYKADKFYANKSPLIAGWGYTRPNMQSSRSTTLLQAQVDIVDPKSCIASYKKSSLIDERVLCASRRYVDSCQGDSGGPLALTIGSTDYLIGIVSYGYGCANPFYPGIYTKVAYYFDWIKSMTGIEF